MKTAAPRSHIPDLLVRLGLSLALAGAALLTIAYFIPPRGF